eukprot:SAG11_NODE_27467_length_332_cov_0.892704_1_plen_68_part_10
MGTECQEPGVNLVTVPVLNLLQLYCRKFSNCTFTKFTTAVIPGQHSEAHPHWKIYSMDQIQDVQLRRA